MAQPKFRLRIEFKAKEIPLHPINPQGQAWQILPDDQEKLFHYDSDSGYYTEKPEYVEELSPKQATGMCFYGPISPWPFSNPGLCLRIFWREIVYANGKIRVDGMIANEAMEGAIGRLRGDVGVTLTTPDGDQTYSVKDATVSDENGCCFELGDLQAWSNVRKLPWFTNRMRSDSPKPPDFFWTPQPCPDARSGDAWQPQWTPFPVNLKNPDGSYVLPKYWNTSDPRNPPIGQNIGDSKVADWYLRQTHGHYREGGEGFRSPWETAYFAAASLGDFTTESQILRSLWDYVRAQVGGLSPTGQGYIDGRPNHLATLDGTLFRAGVKYGLTEVDKAAPYTAVLHEGRPQLGKPGLQFWECFGRDQLHPLEVTQSQFKGLYGLPNGQDGEHCASGPLAAAAILYGDPLAQRQLHHICEEHVSEGLQIHSTRSWPFGWPLVDLGDGYLTFQGNSIFGTDADRYRDFAFQLATFGWQKRFDQTPYLGAASVGYEYYDKTKPESEQPLFEATMQLAISLHAASVWYQLEGNEARKTFWKILGDYIVECLDQPGVIDWSRGGIIQRYALQTPQAVPGGPSASELVEQYAPANYRSREILSDEGWVVPALAEWWLATQNQRAHDMALEGYNVQVAKMTGKNAIYNSLNWSAWGTNFPAVQAFGWAQ